MAPPRSPTDESDEEEATAFDARDRSVAPKGSQAHQGSKSKTGQTPSSVGRSSSRTGPPAPPSSRTGPAAAPPPDAPLHGDDDDDDERTEFLSRPASRPAQSSLPSDSSASLRARGRAVPITPSTPLTAKGEQAQLRARERTEPIAVVVESPLPQRTPRPLPGRASPLSDEPSTTGTVPKITKIRLDDSPTARVPAVDPTSSATDPGAGAARPTARPARAPTAMIRPADLGNAIDIAALDRQLSEGADAKQTASDELEDLEGVEDEPAERAEAPKPVERTDAQKPTAKAARAERSGTRTRSATAVRKTDTTTSESNGDVHGEGTLVIEAPSDAMVFVNGVERGRGVVRVPGMDRFAKHAVRIHASGFAPWSGSVCLEGKLAAKVRPSLKPRAR